MSPVPSSSRESDNNDGGYDQPGDPPDSDSNSNSQGNDVAPPRPGQPPPSPVSRSRYRVIYIPIKKKRQQRQRRRFYSLRDKLWGGLARLVGYETGAGTDMSQGAGAGAGGGPGAGLRESANRAARDEEKDKALLLCIHLPGSEPEGDLQRQDRIDEPDMA